MGGQRSKQHSARRKGNRAEKIHQVRKAQIRRERISDNGLKAGSIITYSETRSNNGLKVASDIPYSPISPIYNI